MAVIDAGGNTPVDAGAVPQPVAPGAPPLPGAPAAGAGPGAITSAPLPPPQ